MTPQDIDAYFDAMLIDGMAAEAALQIETQRNAAHQRLKFAIIERALDMTSDREREIMSALQAPGNGDPIRRVW